MLSISNVPTPFAPTSGGYVVEFSLADASDIPTYRSNIGHFNATPAKFEHNSKTRLQWIKNKFKYIEEGNITQNDLLRFSKSFSYAFKGINQCNCI